MICDIVFLKPPRILTLLWLLKLLPSVHEIPSNTFTIYLSIIRMDLVCYWTQFWNIQNYTLLYNLWLYIDGCIFNHKRCSWILKLKMALYWMALWKLILVRMNYKFFTQVSWFVFNCSVRLLYSFLTYF